FSIWYTAAEPAMAYFITPTRMWELAAGGLVAVFVLYVRPKRLPFSSLLGWIGLAGIVAATFLIRADMPFPGSIALVPVVSTALVILADSRGRASVLPLLSLRPIRFPGDISYSVFGLGYNSINIMNPIILLSTVRSVCQSKCIII